MNRYLSEALIESLEECVAGAIERINRGEISEATVALTLKVKLDEEEGITGEFTEKATQTRKGSFDTDPAPRLPFETSRRGTISVPVP